MEAIKQLGFTGRSRHPAKRSEAARLSEWCAFAHWRRTVEITTHGRETIRAGNVADVDHIVMFSGGLGSWEAAKRVAEKYGTSRLILLFCDTLIEDPDLYRFLPEAAENVGGTLVRLQEGRTPWQVFFDERYLGNSRIDPCSKILKRQISEAWINANYSSSTAVRHVGIDWTEEHRVVRMRLRMDNWIVSAPLCEPPFVTKQRVIDHAKAEGLRIPRLYELGFDHNNCGGLCVKAGQAHFAHALQVIPEKYAEWEQKEQDFIKFIGKPVSILKDRRGGKSIPMTMREFRERLSAGWEFDRQEYGGCSCFSGPDEAQP
jgi:3'-phosphoadenosine 5'-phosphosulfate sulfotransferase (PAPS reductase)/FAD synthetase